VLLVYVVVLLVRMVMFIVELVLVVLLGMVGVGDNSLVVSRLVFGHAILCGFGFRAVPGWVRRVFPIEMTVETFAVAGLCLCLWLRYCRGLDAEGVRDDKRSPQSVVDWQCVHMGLCTILPA
jgi:hypothetical protein